MQYSYKAKNLQGKEKTGFLEAPNQRSLVLALKEQGYFLLSCQAIEEQKTDKKIKSAGSFFLKAIEYLNGLFGVPLKEKLFFTRNLSVMIKAGIPLPKAFSILRAQTKNHTFQKCLQEIEQKIIKGESLSKSLEEYGKIFPPLFKETIKVGEETGKLEESLMSLNNQMSKEYQLKSKIKGAMMYPLIVLCLTFLIGIFMMIFAVPKMKEAFDGLGIELPVTTKAILAFAGFLTNSWMLALPLFLLIFIFFVVFLKNHYFAKTRSWLFLRIPVFGSIVKQSNSALVLRSLSSLLESGVPIVRAITISSGTVNNFYFQQSLNASAKQVEKGEKMSIALSAYQKIYSTMILQMIEVGEETGETAMMLSELAEFLEQEVSSSTQQLSALIEPLLMLFLGGAVGFFAVSMMQPMFSIMQGF